MRRLALWIGLFILGLPAWAQPVKVLTNHIGYDAAAPKHAVVLGHAGDKITAFKLIELETGKEILAGEAKYAGPVAKWKDWVFWTIDFDAAAGAGDYVLECATDKGVMRSFPFKIAPGLLERDALGSVIAYFKGQRSSGLLDKADRTMKFDGAGGTKTVDVHGGWFDATGDYGKHLSHLSFSTYFNPQQIPLTVWSLFKTYEELDRRKDINFTQYKRRLLDEALWGADYLVRVHAPGGSFYRSIGCPGSGKKPEDRRIGAEGKKFSIMSEANQKKEKGEIAPAKPASPASVDPRDYQVGYRNGGGMAIAALALAARYDVSGDFKNSDYLKAAEDAFEYLEKHNLDHANDGKENIVDDYCALMAATELFKATKSEKYKAAADKRAASLMGRLDSGKTQTDYWRADDAHRPFFHAADAGLPVVALVEYLSLQENIGLISPIGPMGPILKAIRRSLEHELAVTGEVANPFGLARQFVQNKAGERRTAFFFPHDTETAPWWQGENARLGSLAAAARLASRQFKDDKAFQDRLRSYADSQLNWILGLNPFDTCMLFGSGRNNADYGFLGTYQYKNAPGGICNGITSSYTDPDGIEFNLTWTQTGKDDDWRWSEQWLPHASWFMYAVACGE